MDNCKKCNRFYNLKDRKPIQCQELQCLKQVCEDCYDNNLAIEDDGAKTCPYCFTSSHKKVFNQKLIDNMEQLEEYKIRSEVGSSQMSTLASSSGMNTIRTVNNVLPKIEFKDVPLESELKYLYRKEKHLGKGSFGDVHSCSTRQMFAIKTFQEQPTEQDLIEVSIMKGIKSQYICELKEFFKSVNNEYCIVYEYAQFGDLKKFCESILQWNIPEHLAKEWLASIVLGLKELHSRGIIHRDIKPDNILVFKEDEVRIADYGQAKTIGDSQSKRPYGTLNYISPEMLKGKSYDFSTDIYSLGITFIYLLTKTFPTKKEIKNSNWLPQIPGMSKEFIALLRKMVSYKSNDRPSIVDLMFHPVIEETQVMIDYRKVYGIMTLGFANFKPDLMKQLHEQGVGCKNCSLVLCNECFRKKVESSFLMLNDMLGHANDISIRIEELVKDAKEELEVCKAVCPEINTNRIEKYTEIIDNSQKMVRHNKRHQVRRAQVQELIKELEPQIVETAHQVTENVEKLEVLAQIADQNSEEINPDIKAKDFSFSDLIKKVKSYFIPESEVQPEIVPEEVSESEDSDLFVDALSTIKHDRNSNNLECKFHYDENLKMDRPLPQNLKTFTSEEFRKLVDTEIRGQKSTSFLSRYISNSDMNTVKLHRRGGLIDFQDEEGFSSYSYLLFIHSESGNVFGVYTKADNRTKIDEGTLITDKDAFIFSFSYQTIHRLAQTAQYSMLATSKGLKVGGTKEFANSDIFIDLCHRNINANSSNLGQSYSLPAGSFEQNSVEAKMFLAGSETFTIKQIEAYHIFSRQKE